MKIHLLNDVERVEHVQEVIMTGRMPEYIRWNGQIYAHHFTHVPHGIAKYKIAVIFDMPEPLPPNMVRSDAET